MYAKFKFCQKPLNIHIYSRLSFMSMYRYVKVISVYNIKYESTNITRKTKSKVIFIKQNKINTYIYIFKS